LRWTAPTNGSASRRQASVVRRAGRFGGLRAKEKHLVRWAQAAMGRLPAALLRGKSLRPFLRVGKLNP
jgi:hypothetical protein